MADLCLLHFHPRFVQFRMTHLGCAPIQCKRTTVCDLDETLTEDHFVSRSPSLTIGVEIVAE